jgi:NTP pyrophosphatase (non-canonical NTP hydrolase)|tara:strand:- start:1957 stop:2283 length:327 start_codon:yes stop_codon:yes gene_type:complete
MSKMTFDEYQEFVATVKRYPQQYNVLYPALGLCGEAGEVAEKVKKRVRDGTKESFKQDITRELGDVLWYISALAGDLGITLQEVADTNKEKLQDRLQRDQIHGDGDER